MIAFAALIVVTDDPLAISSVLQPVLVTVTTARHGRWQLPDDHFDDSTVVEVEPVPVRQLFRHVGNNANKTTLWSMRPALAHRRYLARRPAQFEVCDRDRNPYSPMGRRR